MIVFVIPSLALLPITTPLTASCLFTCLPDLC